MGDNIRIKGEEYAFLVTVLGRGYTTSKQMHTNV